MIQRQGFRVCAATERRVASMYFSSSLTGVIKTYRFWPETDMMTRHPSIELASSRIERCGANRKRLPASLERIDNLPNDSRASEAGKTDHCEKSQSRES